MFGEGEFGGGSGSVVTVLLEGRRQAGPGITSASVVGFSGKTAADTQRSGWGGGGGLTPLCESPDGREGSQRRTPMLCSSAQQKFLITLKS